MEYSQAPSMIIGKKCIGYIHQTTRSPLRHATLDTIEANDARAMRSNRGVWVNSSPFRVHISWRQLILDQQVSLIKMDSFSSLPSELQANIFELAVDNDPKDAPNLSLVSRNVAVW
jgi:hypothetical protein